MFEVIKALEKLENTSLEEIILVVNNEYSKRRTFEEIIFLEKVSEK